MPQPREKPRIPEKCKKCSTFTADVAKSIHGPDGDNCWNPAVCYSRRSHARHRDRRNQKRALKHSSVVAKDISIDIEEYTDIVFAVLIVYRPPGADTPIHAIGADIWKGQEKIAAVQAIHCVGLVRSQILAYVKKMLQVLGDNYGIRKFASLERLDPDRCPIRPCPHHKH
ncbi:MAG: hypothetical protein KME64_03450 [Scytonematopsis contorta HA4267-MV1]|jgi:hypothetical protein|nr:hypothetical protein [Scytonematopsis contorta HA4267-MV1]